MALIGNWVSAASAEVVRLAGKVNILAQKNSVIEMSNDEGATWYEVYTFPNKAEAYTVELSTVTDLRVTGNDWFYSRFNEMSG